MSATPAHSPIGGSSYKRWKNCPGSVALSQTVDEFQREDAAEGDQAHKTACAILEARAAGRPDPDTMEVEDEMMDFVHMYVDHVRSLIKPGAIQRYEHRFHLKKIHPLCFGTADAVTYYPDEQLLVISDLKYGAGVFVSAERNDQLLYYACGAAYSLRWPVKKIRVEIIQPRITYAEAIRPWECTVADLAAFAEQLRKDALATEDPNAPLRAGEWCMFCPAAPFCPLLELRAAVMLASDRGEDDAAKLGRDLTWGTTLEIMIRRKREYAYAMAEKGAKIPGHKLVAKRGRRSYLNEDDAAGRFLFNGFKRDDILTIPEERKLLSPSRIESLPLKITPFSTRAALKEFVSELTTTNSSGNKLVPETEDGEPVKVVTAKSVFSALRPEIAELS